jgi:hypothetical protein
LDPVEEAPVKISETGKLCGVTNTLSRVETPVAVQFVETVVDAAMAPGLTVQVPKSSWVMPEPPEPITLPAVEVVVPVTPSATYGVELLTPSLLLVLSQKRFVDVESADAPLPNGMNPALMFAQPVPPLATDRGDARVSAPAVENDDVAVPPK